jgi:HTH-type transcriptional regulator/antitoxin HigA
METDQAMYSDLPIPPGEYLEEVLGELGMTKDELAKRMNRPAPKLSAIFKGKKAITPDTALQLEKVVGVPAHIWTGLESEYRLTLARLQQAMAQEQLKKETALITRFRYADLARLGLIKKHTRTVDKVLALQKFFGVTSLKTVPSLRRYQPAFRMTNKAQKGQTPEAIAAWLRMGERQAQGMTCRPFRKTQLEAVLDSIRVMTLHEPEQFTTELHHLLSQAGVIVLLCPHLTGTGIHGANFWLGSDKAVVMMTIRYKWADIFWFSLFHELGHILLHSSQIVILEGAEGDPTHKKQEEEADRFAADTLIPPEDYKLFVQNNCFYPHDIQSLAKRIGISPGIVVGRLQNDGLLNQSWHNGLRVRFEWKQRSESE